MALVPDPRTGPSAPISLSSRRCLTASRPRNLRLPPLHQHETCFLVRSQQRPTPNLLGKNPKTRKSCQYPKPQNENGKTKQAIQKQLLRPTKINSAKAVISFSQPDIIEEENKIPDRPGDQPGLSHLNPEVCR